jgi:hypothetical protein
MRRAKDEASYIDKGATMTRSHSFILMAGLIGYWQLGCGGIDQGLNPECQSGCVNLLPGTNSSPTLYSITATITPGTNGVAAYVPAEHKFSALVDWAAKTIITGQNGSVQKGALTESNGVWQTQAGLSFSTEFPDTQWDYLAYAQLRLSPTADGCTGDGSGTYSNLAGDMIAQKELTATLVGTVDHDGPEIGANINGLSSIHPLDTIGVGASEVLPAGTTAEWVSSSGAIDATAAKPDDPANGVSGFLLSERALAFGATYNLQVLPAALDLAGNAATAPVSFSTLPDPGLFAQDGFESAPLAYFSGAVAVVDASALPVPTGNQAIAFSPMSWPPGTGCAARFTARLAVPPGATKVKLSHLPYLQKTRGSDTWPYEVRLGVPDGAATMVRYDDAPSSPLTSRWTDTVPGSADYLFLDLEQMELTLPAGVAGEVIFDITRACLEPPTSISGLVIDDLRVE